jgi:hypothetical protein
LYRYTCEGFAAQLPATAGRADHDPDYYSSQDLSRLRNIVSTALDRAIRRALALEPLLQRKPNTPGTLREVRAAIGDMKAAATADPSSQLPELLLQRMLHLLSSGTATRAALAADVLWRVLFAAPESSVEGLRLPQVRSARS